MEEIRIDVPWGFLAGKWWGPKDSRPILSLHGWQDNASTFDTLIPLLPRHVGYLALDWHGHGLSSHIPPGLHYSSQQFLYLLTYIQHHFKWDKMSIMAHSMSGILSYVYAGLFPDKVDLLVQIDPLKPFELTSSNVMKNLRSVAGTEFLLSDQRNAKKSEPPCHSYDELIQRWVKASNGTLTNESVQYLLRRNICRSAVHPDKFYFRRDGRLKQFSFVTIPHDINLNIGSKIKAPHLFMKATKGPYYESKESFFEMIDLLKKTNPNFEFSEVDSEHHVHLVDPTKVNGKVSEFITKYRPK